QQTSAALRGRGGAVVARGRSWGRRTADVLHAVGDREAAAVRWFVGLSMDDAVWDASTFSKNRERMLEGDIAEAFFEGVLGEARAGQLLSDEHFTVDGTLLEAWASHKSF